MKINQGYDYDGAQKRPAREPGSAASELKVGVRMTDKPTQQMRAARGLLGWSQSETFPIYRETR